MARSLLPDQSAGDAQALSERREVSFAAATAVRVGYLSRRTGPSHIHEAFTQRLHELGYVSGRTLLLERRWADGRVEQLRALADELVRLNVKVLVADGMAAALAAKRATRTIPIVFAVGGHPVLGGLVASMARPGGNATGTALVSLDGGVKRLELLRETVLGVSRVAVLWNPAQAAHGSMLKEVQAVAPSLGMQVHPLEARGVKDFEGAFSWMARWRPGGLLVFDDLVLVEHRRRIVDFAFKERLPTIFGLRVFAEAGGLLAYGPSLAEMSRIAAVYVDKILKGANPAELPVERATRFEVVVNLRTARALGIGIPQSVLVRADEIIQ